nr:thiamine-phosphate kinase [Actinomycetota bacterium]
LPLAARIDEVGPEPFWTYGEDYELLAALPAEGLEAASRAVEEAGETVLTPIGEAGEGEGVEIRLPGGGLLERRGYDHFEGP